MKKYIIMVTVLTMAVMFTGCQGQKNIDLVALWDNIEENVLNSGNAPMITDLPEDSILDMYGINVDDLNEYIFKAALIRLRADEIVFIELKDEDKAKEIFAGIEKRHNNKVKLWSQYLPDQYELVKNAQMKLDGKYIYYIVAEDSEKIVKIFESFLE